MENEDSRLLESSWWELAFVLHIERVLLIEWRVQPQHWCTPNYSDVVAHPHRVATPLAKMSIGSLMFEIVDDRTQNIELISTGIPHGS
jgi:hypothetical protein